MSAKIVKKCSCKRDNSKPINRDRNEINISIVQFWFAMPYSENAKEAIDNININETQMK